MNAKQLIHATVYAQSLGVYTVQQSLDKANAAVNSYVEYDAPKEEKLEEGTLLTDKGTTEYIPDQPAPLPEETFEEVQVPAKRGPGRPRKNA